MTQLTPVLTDAETLRGKIHEKVTGALANVFPMDLKGRTLEVKDLKVHHRDYSSDEQKKALLSGDSLQTPVKGTLVLKGADGRVIDEAKNFTLVHIPYMTPRHTVIADGNEYQFANQIRRKPGVYTQRAENGELKTIFNTGRGKNFDLGFNEAKGTFSLQYGTSNIPLYAALRGLGVTHDEISKHLGEGVAKANQVAHEKHIEAATAKLYQKLEHPAVYDPKLPHVAKAEAIKKKYSIATLDPDVTEHTLGQAHDRVTPTALLHAAKKMLAVHNGKIPVDDTDSLTFKTFHAVDDFLAERIRLTARTWAPKAKMAFSGKNSIREALRPAPFSDSIRKFVTTSSLTAVPSGINPLELMDHAVKVTSLGEGGISSDRAIPLDARMTHATHFGALDPIRTPESGHAGVDIRATIAAHRDDQGNFYTAMKDVKTGKQVFMRAGDLVKNVVAFPGQNLKGGVKAFVNGKIQEVPGSRVTHEMLHLSHQYSPATSLIPMIHNIQGNRAIMGSKMGTQALPLLERETPYVQVKSHLPGEVSFEKVYGHLTVPTAPVSGTIEKIKDGYIYIRPHSEKTAEDVPYFPEEIMFGARHHGTADEFFTRDFLRDYERLQPGYAPRKMSDLIDVGYSDPKIRNWANNLSEEAIARYATHPTTLLASRIIYGDAVHGTAVGQDPVGGPFIRYVVPTTRKDHKGTVIRHTGTFFHPELGELQDLKRRIDANPTAFSTHLDDHLMRLAPSEAADPYTEAVKRLTREEHGKMLGLSPRQYADNLDYTPATPHAPPVRPNTAATPHASPVRPNTAATPHAPPVRPNTAATPHAPPVPVSTSTRPKIRAPYAKALGGLAAATMAAAAYRALRPRHEAAEQNEKTADEKGLIKVPYETNFPFPSKTYLHHDIQVKPGQKVQQGQRLGDSNFTRNGTLALGKNLLVGYMAYHGLNSNDAVVISEGCSKKLTSEHMYREIYPLSSQIELSRDKHKSYYGTKFTPQQYAKLDASGVIKPGTRVDPKDPLVLGLTRAQIQGQDLLLGRISKSLTKPYKDVVLQWEHGTPGVVVEVLRSSGQIAILIKTQEQMQVGDKLAGRYGNKGVVAKIVPDHEMIQDEKGRPLDLILTSAGVVSRINPAQVIETAVGKVVEKTGKPILYDNQEHKDAVQWAKGLLKEHGIKDKEHVFDPLTKRKIVGPDGKGVLVGRQFIYKLFKSTDTNFSGHGVGPYDVNEQPLKTGGDESAKGIGKMEFDAIVAHNARNFLQEAASIKGQKNDEFWRAIQLGMPLPTPKPSFAFNKFTAMLEGAGIKVDKRGSKFKLLPLTDKDITQRSKGAITEKETLIAKNLRPIKDGLFDPLKTGGPQGTLYSHIDLHEPIPNPVFTEPVRRLLGLSTKDFEQRLHDHGGAWFHKELKKIDVDTKINELTKAMNKASGPELDNLVKQVKYLRALKSENLKPHEAYILSKVPVIPPVFRPVLPEVRDPSKLMVADANKLYGHLLDTNNTLKTTALESDRGKHRTLVFKSVGAVFGMNDPEDEKLQKQEVKGFLQNIAGVGTPKGGFFQRKLMRRTQDVSGRGTAVPDGNLGMDEVGIPEQMLWQMLDKLIVARLVRQGYPALQARDLVDKKAPVAREAMLAESRERPVLINRAPTLHRWSVVAAYPKPVQGKTIRVNPFVEKGMNLDYDGDTLQVHAPVQPGAVEDAKKMTLSQMLLADQQRNKLMAFPQHEAIIGFTLASKATPTGPTHRFKTRDEAMAAWRSGKLKLTDGIIIEHEKKAAADEFSDALDGTPVTADDALCYYPAESVTGHEEEAG